jgi:hypothetical protein
MLPSSKSQLITISCGGSTISYRPRTLVPHSRVAANRSRSMLTGTWSQREYNSRHQSRRRRWPQVGWAGRTRPLARFSSASLPFYDQQRRLHGSPSAIGPALVAWPLPSREPATSTRSPGNVCHGRKPAGLRAPLNPTRIRTNADPPDHGDCAPTVTFAALPPRRSPRRPDKRPGQRGTSDVGAMMSAGVSLP